VSPEMKKLILTLMGILYVLSPYDLIPDFFIGVGWLDDLLVLFLLWRYVLSPNKRPFPSWASTRKKPGAHSSSGARSREDHQAGPSSPGEQGVEADPYRILGLEPGASREEISRAYRQLAGKYHPDKVQHLGEEFKALAEKRFIEIQKAYSYLMDRVRL